MRILAASAALAMLVSASPSAGQQQQSESRTMTPGDRQRLLAHLEMTEDWLTGEVGGLTPAQARFQMTPESWSITQVVEHLAIAEPQYWTMVEESLKQPATTEKLSATDAQILWYGIDRTDRQKTGEARVPKGKFEDVRDALASVRKLRATIREFSSNTQENLRSKKLQGGNMEVYQWVLMISTHSQRHILQIREIKNQPKYPKS
jgi:DinB superfamily